MSGLAKTKALVRPALRRWRRRAPWSLVERLDPRRIRILVPERPLPVDFSRPHAARPDDAPRHLARAAAREAAGRPVVWSPRKPRFARPVWEGPDPAAGPSAPGGATGWGSERPFYDWHEGRRVLAVVPHFEGERWLARCLESLVRQTRPLDGIVVVDDCSPSPPTALVRRFPEVTLLVAGENTGPFRLLQTIAERTDFDAFLMQDADDWSAEDRLERQLEVARHTGAELIGTQELRVFDETGEIELNGFPADANGALAERPVDALLHGTSLVTAALLSRVGGVATGLRFGADSELLFRCHWVGRVVNSGDYLYFRRMHDGSLTSSTETGSGSPGRIAVAQAIDRAARQRYVDHAAGRPVDLSPMAVAGEIALRHVCGPPLPAPPGV